MVRSVPYLTFNGNCREAMQFYCDCLGGELRLQTIGDTPDSGGFTENMKQLVLHAELRIGKTVLMASDLAQESRNLQGNTIAIFLEFKNEALLRNSYEKLIANGSVIQALEYNHYETLTGSFIDRYCIRWIFCFTPET